MIFRKLGNDILVNNVSLLYVTVNEYKKAVDYVLANGKIVSEQFETVEEAKENYMQIDTTGLLIAIGYLINPYRIESVEHTRFDERRIRYNLGKRGYVEEKHETAEKAQKAFEALIGDTFIDAKDGNLVNPLKIDAATISPANDKQVEFLLESGKTVKELCEDTAEAGTKLEEAISTLKEYEYTEIPSGTPVLPEEGGKQAVSIKFTDEKGEALKVDVAKLSALTGTELLRKTAVTELTGEVEKISDYELQVIAETYKTVNVEIKAEEIEDYTLTLVKKHIVVDPLTIGVTPVGGLVAPVATDTKVADLKAAGGTPEYTFELAGGKDDGKFKIEEAEVKAGEELKKGEYTIKVKVKDSKNLERESTDTEIKVDYDIKDITDIFKVRGDEERTFNKEIKDLQENISYENTGKGTGKVTGTIKWITNYTNPAYQEGNVISMHVNGEKLPEGDIKYVFGTQEATPDKQDWNVNLKLNGKDDLTFKIKVDEDIIYTLDLKELVLMPDVSKEMVKEKLDEAAKQVNAKMDYAKLSVDDNNKATCTISNGEKTVFQVYQDIISTIFDVLKENADVFAEITGGGKSIHIKKDSNIDGAELVSLVKAVLPKVGGQTTIKELYNEVVNLQVVATDGDKFDWQLEFKQQ